MKHTIERLIVSVCIVSPFNSGETTSRMVAPVTGLPFPFQAFDNLPLRCIECLHQCRVYFLCFVVVCVMLESVLMIGEFCLRPLNNDSVQANRYNSLKYLS